jgi:hypothetical protein
MTSKISFSQFKKQGILDVVALANAGTTVIENVQTAPVATSSTPGIVQPDNTTITISGGVITSVGGGGSSTGIIPGSNGNLRWYSPDGGISVRIQTLVGGVFIDTGWEADVQAVTPPTGAYKIVAMYVDGTTLLPTVIYDDGGGGTPSIPSNALQIQNIYINSTTLQFTIVYLGADMALHTITLSSFTTPTGTGFAHVTAGVLDAAATPNTPQVSANFKWRDTGTGVLILQKSPDGGTTWNDTDTQLP